MNWFDDPTALAAKLTALFGALWAAVSLVVGAIQEDQWPDGEAVMSAVGGLVVAAVGVLAILAARKRAIAPATVVHALTPGEPGDTETLLAQARSAR